MLTDDRSPLPFSLLYSIRSNLAANRLLAVFTIIAIATAVGLATGLEISTRSAQEELERTADALAGAAQLEITGGSLGIPDFLTDQVAAIPGVLAASPFIQRTLRIADGPQAGQPLHILGLDFLADSRVRSYRITRSDLEIRDPLMLLADPHSIIGTQRLLDRLGIKERGSFRVRTSRGPVDLVVRGLLDSEGIGDVFDGQVAAMDIFSLQLLLRREGLVDRIDIVPERGMDLSELRSSLGAAVEGFATVRRAATRNILVERMLGTVKLAVWALAIVGVLVATFLSYGTMSMSVDRRINEFALLQATGLEGYKVRRLIRTDALVLATIGTALGTLLGIALSHIFIDVFSNISDHLQDVEISGVDLRWETVLVAVFVGLVVSYVATLKPSSRATASPPWEVLLNLQAARRRRFDRRVVLLLVSSAVTFLAAGWLLPSSVPPLLRVAILFLAAMIFLISLLGSFLQPILIGVTTVTRGLFRTLGGLVGLSLIHRPAQTALTTAALGGVMGGIVGILITLESVVVSVDEWLAPKSSNEVIVTTGDPFRSEALSREAVLPETIELIRSSEGVLDVLENVHSHLMYQGESVRLNAQSMEISERYIDIPAANDDWRRIAHALTEGGVAISEAFSRRFDISAGGRIWLDTPLGPHLFEVKGVFQDFAGPPSGTIKLDTEVFDSFWPREGAFSLVIWTEENQQGVMDRIRKRVGTRQLLYLTRSEDYAEYARRTVDRYIHLLYMIGGLASAVAGLSVLNLSFGYIAERGSELTLLRYAGASSWQIFGIVSIDSGLLAAMGITSGLILGLVCSSPMLDIVGDSMGWTLTGSIPHASLAYLAIGMAMITCTASAFPAMYARRMKPTEMFSPS